MPLLKFLAVRSLDFALKFLFQEIFLLHPSLTLAGFTHLRSLHPTEFRFTLALCFLSSACQISKNRAYATKSHRFLFLLRFVHSFRLRFIHNGGYQQLRFCVGLIARQNLHSGLRIIFAHHTLLFGQ